MQGGAVAPDTTQGWGAAAGKPSQEHMERAALRVREPQGWKRPLGGLLQTSCFTDEETETQRTERLVRGCWLRSDRTRTRTQISRLLTEVSFPSTTLLSISEIPCPQLYPINSGFRVGV